MAAAILDRIPVDEITERAAAMRPGRFALTLCAAPLVLVGWLCAIVFAVAWKAGKWITAAFLVGWGNAHGPSKADQIAQLKAQLADRDMRLSRFSG